MFSAVLGLFSQDLAVDLGSSRTRVYLKGSGIVRDEPTVVAIQKPPDGERSVIEIGEAAARMLGRTPTDIDAVQPVREGLVRDYEVVEAFLLQLVREIHGRNSLMRPRMAVTIPYDASDMAHRAVRACCEFAGAREVSLVPRPLAAAVGAGLPVHEAAGCMIVDIGGGSAEAAVLSLSQVVRAERIPGGGGALDQALIDHLRLTGGLQLGHPGAERAKLELGGLAYTGGTLRVRGRCTRTGLPRVADAESDGLRGAMMPPIAALALTIRSVLDQVPDELATDVLEQGVVLVGGGARLEGLDRALREATGLPIVVADEPDLAVIRGAGALLEESDRLRAIAS